MPAIALRLGAWGGGSGRQKGQGKRAGAKRGKGKEKEEVASEGITYVGETSFLFSHIHQVPGRNPRQETLLFRACCSSNEVSWIWFAVLLAVLSLTDNRAPPQTMPIFALHLPSGHVLASR